MHVCLRFLFPAVISNDTNGTQTDLRSDKAIMKAEREIERFQKERERCEAQMKTASDDVANISMINNELKGTSTLDMCVWVESKQNMRSTFCI